MPAGLIERISTRTAPTVAPRTCPAGIPDPGYEALGRLLRLRDDLAKAATSRRSPWKEPPLFFFSERAQTPSPSTAGPYAAIAAKIAAELPRLCASVEVRRVARSIDGLRTAAEALAPRCAAAKELAGLLAIPDDEVVVAIHPARRAGYRFSVRGIADVGQFHVLLANLLGDSLASPIPARFVAACRNSGPPVPAGIPMTMEARFQMYLPAVLHDDGTLPPGFAGCGHWLWPETSLSTLPLVGGERMVLLGPPAYRSRWDVGARFPGLSADLRHIETLNPFRVVEYLTRILGRPLSSPTEREQHSVLPQAA